MILKVDRIEGGKIVLELPDKSNALLDLSAFPEAHEGDVLTIEKDEQATKNDNNRIRNKFEALKKHNT